MANFSRKIVKIHKIGGFGCKKSSKFEENSMINIYSLVPQIDLPVALCNGVVRIGSQFFAIIFGVNKFLQTTEVYLKIKTNIPLYLFENM